MNITVIYGNTRTGSTYNVTRLFLSALRSADSVVSEFFLPRDFDDICRGCFACITRGEEYCPHGSVLQPITNALIQADLIILASPVYVFGMSGQLKLLMDHFAYRWMPHRPHPSMFSKVGLVISTASGMGTGKTNRTLKDNLFYWGVPKIFCYGANVSAMRWEDVSPVKKKKIEKDAQRISGQIQKGMGHVRPGLKTKFIFNLMRSMQKGNDWNPTDRKYWEQNGWLGKKRPW